MCSMHFGLERVEVATVASLKKIFGQPLPSVYTMTNWHWTTAGSNMGPPGTTHVVIILTESAAVW